MSATGKAQRFVEEQLLRGVGNVIFTADHMGDGHRGVINHHNKVVEGVADLIGGSATGNHHVSAKVGSLAKAHRRHAPDHSSEFRRCVIDAKTDHRFTAFCLETPASCSGVRDADGGCRNAGA